MSKLKTHKGLQKRIKFTKGGKGKPTARRAKRKQRFSKDTADKNTDKKNQYLSKTDKKLVSKLLPGKGISQKSTAAKNLKEKNIHKSVTK